MFTQGFNGQVTVTTAATRLFPSDNFRRGFVTITNTDATDPVYLGNANTVTTTSGYPIQPLGVPGTYVNPGSTLTVHADDDLYLIAGSSVVVAYWAEVEQHGVSLGGA